MPDTASKLLLPFDGSFYGHLSQNYPTLLSRNEDLRIEIGPGWVRPVCELLQTMEATAVNDPKFMLLQVKEKFGTLRVYYTPHNQKLDNEIESTDAICQSRCLVCGEQTESTTRPNSSRVALCRKHYDAAARGHIEASDK